IKRNLQWSIDAGKPLGVPTAPLSKLLEELDRLSFAEIADRSAAIRLDFQKWFGDNIHPLAPAYLVLGIHEGGAEGVALEGVGFARADRPGTGALIERNGIWMRDLVNDAKLEVTVGLVEEVLKRHGEGASFQELFDKLSA